MDTTVIITTVIGSVLGSTGLFSLVQFLFSRHDAKKRENSDMEKRLVRLEKTSDQTILRVTRMELNNLIHDDPDNIEAIIQVAKYYFLDLDGNAYAHAKFEKWASEHDVPTNWLPSMRPKK